MRTYRFHYYNEINRLRAYALELPILDEMVTIFAPNRDEAWSMAIKHSENYTLDRFVIEAI